MAGKYKPAIKKLDYYETGGGGGGGAVDSVNTRTGDVVLDSADVGLGNVDNTSDVNKPVSTAQQTALDGKVDENAPITGATKTKITYDTKGLVTAGTDATTADIADSSNKRYVTDAEKTVIGNTSGVNTGDQNLTPYQLKPSEGAFVNGDKTKLDGIEAGAEVNNISDANATDLTDGGATTLHSHAGGGAPADQAAYTFSTTTTASDPGASYVRLNRAADTVNNKVLTSNVATLTTVATHGYTVGDYVYVSIGDAVFDGLQRVTAVNAGTKTFSYVKVNANVTTVATSGTAFNYTLCTQMYIDPTGNASTDYTEYLKRLTNGDNLVLTNGTTVTKWLRVKVTNTPVDNAGWYTIPIQVIKGVTHPANAEVVNIVFELNNVAGLINLKTGNASTTMYSKEALANDRLFAPPSSEGALGDISLPVPRADQNTFPGIDYPTMRTMYQGGQYGVPLFQKQAEGWEFNGLKITKSMGNTIHSIPPGFLYRLQASLNGTEGLGNGADETAFTVTGTAATKTFTASVTLSQKYVGQYMWVTDAKTAGQPSVFLIMSISGTTITVDVNIPASVTSKTAHIIRGLTVNTGVGTFTYSGGFYCPTSGGAILATPPINGNPPLTFFSCIMKVVTLPSAGNRISMGLLQLGGAGIAASVYSDGTFSIRGLYTPVDIVATGAGAVVAGDYIMLERYGSHMQAWVLASAGGGGWATAKSSLQCWVTIARQSPYGYDSLLSFNQIGINITDSTAKFDYFGAAG